MNLRDALNAFYYSSALCDLQLMNRKFTNPSITYNSLLYLEIIYSMHGTCTASRLAELLCVSKPGVTSKLNELIEQGLVVRKPDPNDGRKYFLFVNEDKVPQYRIYRQQDDLAVKTITEQYSGEDIEKFCAMLQIITSINYEDANKTRESYDYKTE